MSEMIDVRAAVDGVMLLARNSKGWGACTECYDAMRNTLLNPPSWPDDCPIRREPCNRMRAEAAVDRAIARLVVQELEDIDHVQRYKHVQERLAYWREKVSEPK